MQKHRLRPGQNIRKLPCVSASRSSLGGEIGRAGGQIGNRTENRWQKLIDSGVYRNANELAKAIGKDHAFVARTTRLTLLAPEIIHAVLAGTLQRNIPIENFRKEMPIRREDQKKLFGIE